MMYTNITIDTKLLPVTPPTAAASCAGVQQKGNCTKACNMPCKGTYKQLAPHTLCLIESCHSPSHSRGEQGQTEYPDNTQEVQSLYHLPTACTTTTLGFTTKNAVQ